MTYTAHTSEVADNSTGEPSGTLEHLNPHTHRLRKLGLVGQSETAQQTCGQRHHQCRDWQQSSPTTTRRCCVTRRYLAYRVFSPSLLTVSTAITRAWISTTLVT